MERLTSKQKLALAEMMVGQPTLFDHETFKVVYVVDAAPKGAPSAYPVTLDAWIGEGEDMTARERLVWFLKCLEDDPRTFLVQFELLNAAAFSGAANDV